MASNPNPPGHPGGHEGQAAKWVTHGDTLSRRVSTAITSQEKAEADGTSLLRLGCLDLFSETLYSARHRVFTVKGRGSKFKEVGSIASAKIGWIKSDLKRFTPNSNVGGSYRGELKKIRKTMESDRKVREL